MESLGQIKVVANNLKTGSTKAVKALHKIIFEQEGDRNNRKRLREFRGLPYAVESEEYKSKIAFVETHLGWGDLVSVCNILAIDYAGTKKELSQRLCGYLTDLNALNDVYKTNDEDDNENEEDAEQDENNKDDNDEHDEDDQDDEDNQDDEDIRNDEDDERSPTRTHRLARTKFTMTFRDVEDSIRHFDGDEKYPVKQWIEDIEESAELYGWSDIQKLVFAKKSLKGLAKLFVQGERGITTWKKLKKALKDEFGDALHSAELHQLLKKRKIKKSESVQAYFLAMKEIAARGEIEDEALFYYVIEGIEDKPANKSVLYGAKDMKQFKDKLKIYDRMRVTTLNLNKATNQVVAKQVKTNEDTRCYNCGTKGHRSTDCSSKSKGAKCFNCNEFGHKANECKREKTKKKKEEEEPKKIELVSNLDAPKNMYKIIEIQDRRVNALIDTGSQINIINESTYKKIGNPTLSESNLYFTGFGRNKVQPIGYFKGTITIVNDSFPTTIYVVTDDVMIMEAVVGNELLSQAELTVNRDGISIKKTEENVLPSSYMIDVDAPEIGNVNETRRKEVEDILEHYEPKKTKDANIQMTITTTDTQKIYAKPRRLPFSERKIVETQVERWIEEGIAEPCSSEYASPVVVVKKKDGTPRVCVDYRAINKIISKDRYPLPLMEDVLDQLQDARVFSTLDMKNGFFHVDVEEASRKYTAFVTSNGHYRFRKVPFGLCNSPAVFQRFVNEIFKDLTVKGIALPYVDDLIIPAMNEDEAVDRLKIVLERAGEYGLEINKKKCQLLMRRVEFLGHVIENGKIYPSLDKTKAVMKFPEPRTIKQVQSYLGLTGYFRKFIPGYAKIAKPLSDLLKKKTSFQFGTEQRNAFNQLKKCLSQEPVLGIFNQNHETEVHTDASQEGYGAVLLQRSPVDGQLHPVYFMSKKTTEAEKKYSSYELEVLAVVSALKKFRVYLLGKTIKIVTDCSAFRQTMSKKDLTPRVARWALLLEDFSYEIEHRSGTKMRHVDALSRNPVMAINIDSVHLKIKRAQDKDDEIKNIKTSLEETSNKDYRLHQGVLYKYADGYELLVVPKSMQDEVIKNAHEKGHFAVKRTEENIKREFYIPNLKTKIERCIANCLKCILVNKKAGKLEGFLHPMVKEDIPLHTYHIDHMGPLESTPKNYKYILAVIDAFTKFVWLYPTKTTTTKEVIQKLDLQKSIFGNPSWIISDRGTAFTSAEFEDYCQQEKIQHAKITTGLPRANGQIERINRTIIPVLAKMTIEEPTKWYKHVSKLQQMLNSTYQRSINTTPLELLIGTKMRTNEDYRMKEIIEQEMIHDFEDARNQLRSAAKKQIEKIQEENRKHYNLRRRNPHKYHLNDLVAIKRTQFGPGLKLKTNYLGPYRVSKVKPGDTYDVVREGLHEGPIKTTTCAEYMKRWSEPLDDSASPGSDDDSGGPNCGIHGSKQAISP